MKSEIQAVKTELGNAAAGAKTDQMVSALKELEKI